MRLLDLAFTWKSQEEDDREVVFLGGDIHCGVTSGNGNIYCDSFENAQFYQTFSLN